MITHRAATGTSAKIEAFQVSTSSQLVKTVCFFNDSTFRKLPHCLKGTCIIMLRKTRTINTIGLTRLPALQATLKVLVIFRIENVLDFLYTD